MVRTGSVPDEASLSPHLVRRIAWTGSNYPRRIDGQQKSSEPGIWGFGTLHRSAVVASFGTERSVRPSGRHWRSRRRSGSVCESRSVDVRLEGEPILVGGQIRHHIVKKGHAFFVGETADPTHRTKECDQPVAVDGLWIWVPRFLEWFEYRRGERTWPVACGNRFGSRSSGISISFGQDGSSNRSTSAIDGSTGPDGRFHIRMSAPDGRSTRAISASARSWANQWKASATKTRSPMRQRAGSAPPSRQAAWPADRAP